jgi:hypothetical protein
MGLTERDGLLATRNPHLEIVLRCRAPPLTGLLPGGRITIVRSTGGHSQPVRDGARCLAMLGVGPPVRRRHQVVWRLACERMPTSAQVSTAPWLVDKFQKVVAIVDELPRFPAPRSFRNSDTIHCRLSAVIA